MHFLEILKNRDLIQDISDEQGLLDHEIPYAFYVGFDPTAPSLQIGNLVPLIASIHMAKAGLQPIILFGGATGAIGDPSGKNEERKLLDHATLDRNIAKQEKQITALFNKLDLTPKFVNNLDWTKDVSVLEFLREVGKFITVNYMLGKEVVKSRLEGSGISFTEFSYMLLQAFDFVHLYQNHNCILQVGGSDQWGNITAGLELIRKKIQGEAFAFSFPLLTDSSGKKFGKTEAGAIWLDPELTSPYQLHQFLLNVDDQDAIKLLRIFSFLELTEIEELAKLTEKEPEKRTAQKVLADQVCELVHGEQATADAKVSADVLFGGELDGVSDTQLAEIFKDVPSKNLNKSSVSDMSLLDFFVEAGAVKSKGDAKRLIKGGGAYINNKRVQEISATVADAGVLDRGICIIRTGKKSYYLVRLSDE